MDKYPVVNGFLNRQYRFNGPNRTIEFPFKGEFIKLDLSTPDIKNRTFSIGDVEYRLLIEYKGGHKMPKFYITQEDRDKDKKLKEGIVIGGWGFLENTYYGALS